MTMRYREFSMRLLYRQDWHCMWRLLYRCEYAWTRSTLQILTSSSTYKMIWIYAIASICNSPDLELKAHESHSLGSMSVCASKYGLIRRSLTQSMLELFQLLSVQEPWIGATCSRLRLLRWSYFRYEDTGARQAVLQKKLARPSGP